MSQPTPPSQPVRKLPIAETIGEAYRSVFNNLAAWLQITVGPVLLAVAIAVIERALFGSGLAERAVLNSESPEAITTLVQAVWLVTVLEDFIACIPYVFFAVAWHRFVLLGERPTFALNVLRPERRHMKFYLYIILLIMFYSLATAFIAVSILSIITTTSDGAEVAVFLVILLLFLLFVFISIYVNVRLQFVFPALAVDEQYGFGDSWRNTCGQAWRLLLVLVCCFLPLLFVGIALSAPLLGAMSNTVLFFISPFIISAIGLLATAVCVSAISIAFRTCTGWIPPAADQPPANV